MNESRCDVPGTIGSQTNVDVHEFAITNQFQITVNA